MLVGTQLKLYERPSSERTNEVHTCRSYVINRPCTRNNITGVQPRVSNSFVIPEKRCTELRVVSLNLNKTVDSSTSKKRPVKMPLYCTHYQRLQKIYHKDNDKGLNDDFLVRGTELRTGSADSHNEFDNSLESNDTEVFSDANGDQCSNLTVGIQIQLTDCCQCVCDLVNSNFQMSQDDDHDFSFAVKERSHKAKEVQKSIIDPDILKVIRITMSTKH